MVEPAQCPVCGTSYDPLRARAVRVVDGRVRAFCSASCRDRDASQPESDVAAVTVTRPNRALLLPALLRRAGFAASGLATVAVVLIVGVRLLGSASPNASASALHIAPMAPAPVQPAAPPTVNLEHLGLSADGTARKAPAKTEVADAPADNDVWVHPLPGPIRRLPLRDTRRFGAAREGMRPEECEGGHCGVDLGSEIGELVMAAHDGVVERVVRDPNEGGRRGNEGRFIRISHKGGTIVTSYIHLDSIRDDLRPGVPVKVGEVIGQIGDSGVQRSGPHLHFAVSVRRAGDSQELFIDPEPMLHLWPLRPRPQVSARGLHLSRNF